MSAPKPVALIIMDGFGLRNTEVGNAVAQANKPNYDRYLKQYPNTTLTACGEAVGLPEGQMGNSEVGHLNIGAGRIVYQDLTRITKSIREGEFFENETLVEAVRAAKNNNKKRICTGWYPTAAFTVILSICLPCWIFARRKIFMTYTSMASWMDATWHRTAASSSLRI